MVYIYIYIFLVGKYAWITLSSVSCIFMSIFLLLDYWREGHDYQSLLFLKFIIGCSRVMFSSRVSHPQHISAHMSTQSRCKNITVYIYIYQLTVDSLQIYRILQSIFLQCKTTYINVFNFQGHLMSDWLFVIWTSPRSLKLTVRPWK